MIKFDFNDILIEPAITSDISSRKEINPFYSGFLPLFTAPMDTVISTLNVDLFLDNKIFTCFSRGEGYNEDGFLSFSLKDFTQMIQSTNELGDLDPKGSYLIDLANGHMRDLLNVVRAAKAKYPEMVLMVGNIANPQTYVKLSDAGADFIRVGIGNGGGCLTTQNLGVGYPMASLIQECYQASMVLKKPAKIIADGGMKDYSDIIKALALGADYVMLGNILNKTLESAGDNYLFKCIKVPQDVAETAYKLGLPVYKKFRGMSTKEVQKKWGNKTLKTSEGVVRFRKVEYTLQQWVENFEDYLRSAMSYSNATNLNEFIGYANIIKITDSSYNRFKK